MRVAYYTRPAFLDHSLSLVRAVAQWADVHMFLELSPEERATGMLGETGLSLRQGVRSASEAVEFGYLTGARAFLRDLASFHLVVHQDRRAFAPGSLRTSLAAGGRIGAVRPHILHLEDLGSRSAPLMYFTPGVPKIVSIHDATNHPGERAERARRVRELATRRANWLLFYSHDARTRFLAERSRPSSVVPLGIKELFREWPTPEPAFGGDDGRTLLFFGRISAYKGLDVLYQAMPTIAARVPGVRLVVAGRPAAQFAMPEVPALCGGGQICTQLGQVDVGSVRGLFQRATVVVVPYVEASQSGVVQTAFAFRKPVVASAVGGLPESVRQRQTGLLVPPRDPAALADAVVELLLDAGLRAHMSDQIQRLEETEQGWGPIGCQLRKLYARVAGRQAGCVP